MQRLNGRVAAQRADHRIGAIAFDGDRRQRADAVRLSLGLEPQRVADDRAVRLQPRDAVLHGRARDLQLLRERDQRAPRVVAQQGDEVLVDVVHAAPLTGSDLIVVPREHSHSARSA